MRLSGKKDISLSSLIDKSGKATDVIRCKELADELIRSICPEITGNGKCDMLLTFSDDFSYDPYGYYFMIDKEGIVYSCIIIHQWTQFKVYQNGQFIMDLGPKIAGTIMKLDKETSERILDILKENNITPMLSADK